jgi:ribosomal-protein-alanine N-acetyltransferase
MKYRRMTAADVEVVAELEHATFSTPWQADTFRTLLERPGCEMHVVEVDGEVAGYSVLWCIMDQGELANIAICEPLRGRGLAGGLLDNVIEVARERGVRSLFLEVRVSNAAAAALYASREFREIGRRINYYDRPREDARVLEKRL